MTPLVRLVAPWAEPEASRVHGFTRSRDFQNGVDLEEAAAARSSPKASVVPGLAAGRFQVGVGQVTEGREPVVDGDDDHVAQGGEPLGPVHGPGAVPGALPPHGGSRGRPPAYPGGRRRVGDALEGAHVSGERADDECACCPLQHVYERINPGYGTQAGRPPTAYGATPSTRSGGAWGPQGPWARTASNPETDPVPSGAARARCRRRGAAPGLHGGSADLELRPRAIGVA